MQGCKRVLYGIGLLAASLGLFGLSGPARANHEYARVVHVEPIYEYYYVDQPRRRCWDEVVHEPRHTRRRLAPVVAGGVIGGVIAHELSHGPNHAAMTLLGAAAGSAIAHEYASRHDRHHGYRTVHVERCEVVHDGIRERRIQAYEVTYRYRGHRHRMRTGHHPGKHVRVPVRTVRVWR